MDLDYLKNSGQFKKKDYWQLKLWSAYSMFIATIVFAISQSTKHQIVRHYPFATNKVKVTLLAYDKDKFNTRVSLKDVRRIKIKYSIANKYLLFLSTLKPSKNIENLIDAWKSIVHDFPDFQLVIAGKKGWLYQSIFQKVQQMNMEDKVIFTDFVPESEKPTLIGGAYVFVLPSFWEGFGLDPLNAMACGVPVIVSNTGSLQEVAGEAGVYVEPKNVDSISTAIRKVLSWSKLDYNKQVAKGLKQVEAFSWENTAENTLSELRKATDEHI